jgi:hypothetical protein
MLLISTPPTPIETRNESAFIVRISETIQSFTSAPTIEVSEPIPESFLAGWADYKAGRVVDMDRALGDEHPPGV